MNWLLTLRIDRLAFLLPLYLIAAALALTLLVGRPRRALRGLLATIIGAGIGLVAAFLVSDVWNLFGVPLTAVTRMWVVFAFAGAALAIAQLWRPRWWLAVVAVVAIPVFIITAAAGINVDFGAYRNLSDALGINPYGAVSATHLRHAAIGDPPVSPAAWRPPAGMPLHGSVGTATIPGTVSGFAARSASVYLPPAALVAQPPVLPVIIAFSGQPGAPSDMFTSGQMPSILDSYAAAHRGLAPIVVVPDQLGAPERNPMCVDSPLGNSARYLTVDVPAWVKAHLRVSSDPRYWAVAGFSQGGTCAIQFGAARPDLFQTILDISGEEAPTIGQSTIQRAFGGSQSAYDKAKPITILAAKAPYADSTAIFGVGQADASYAAQARAVKAAAEQAGMTTQLIESPQTAHDWNTVRYVMQRALPLVADRLGMGS